jgi:peptidoglycan hydrolase-like protein with peptidoglycan-binding domain
LENLSGFWQLRTEASRPYSPYQIVTTMMNRKRILTIFLVLGTMIISAGGSWYLGSKIQSPAEAAARTAPPEPSPILVPVEERVLNSRIVARGTARYGLPQTISVAPSSLKGDIGLITRVPLRNTQLNEGSLLLTASGRPVFVLFGETPAYRDMIPGLSGDDVLQLEQALERMGFRPGQVDGLYDDRTGTAVFQWYTAAGFDPFAATPEQLATIRSLEQELAAAQINQVAVDQAASTAPLAVTAAQSDLWAASSAAQATVDELTYIRNELWRDWAPDQDRIIADNNLAAAKAALSAIYTSAQAAIQAAKDAQSAAEREAVAAAERVEQITVELERARYEAGVKVPLDEIVFLPSLPVRVEQVDVVVGDAVVGPVMVVTNNQVAIDSSVPLDEAALIKPGMAVAIDEPDLGIEATGTIVRVADGPGTNGVDGFHVYFETFVDETPIALEGFSLRLTLTVESTGGAVTAVPISALTLAADGRSRLQVANNGSLEFVVVEPGLSADGFVEVAPIEGTLEAGQMVVIGFQEN